MTFMKVNGKMVNQKVMEDTFGPMEIITLDFGMEVKKMEKDKSLTKMELLQWKESSRMASW